MSTAKKSKNPRAHTQHYYLLSPEIMILSQSKRRKPSVPRSNIFIEKLPHCTYDTYIRDGIAAEIDRTSNTSLYSSVKGVSLLVCLLTISFPESYSFDIMHLIYLRFIRDLCALVNSIYFSKEVQSSLNTHSSCISEKN
jgi:hypothetical protein